MKILYRLHSIRKCYGSNVVLDIEELTIVGGRLYTLTGPNGAGKSTLLNILAFLCPPTSGEIHYAGKRVDWDRVSLERPRRNVTLLHQSPYLFEGTVHANVDFGLKARGIPGEERRRITEKALATVGLQGFGDRKARELSGGETQRVAMARALALDPEVLLLDEPLANIDRETAILLESVISALPSRGTTVVMITHDPDQPDRLNGESILLEGGKVAIQHPPAGRTPMFVMPAGME
jgi:tungstate transport system ATP-binding protein